MGREGQADDSETDGCHRKNHKTTICGTDLHILGGDVPAVTDGRTLGHEGVGIVEEVGTGVNNFKPGDSVLISCVTSCGRCDYCKKAMYAHCEDVGWILGHLIDGLLRNQEENGSWYGRWGISYLYGTWAAVTGMIAVGVPPEHPAISTTVTGTFGPCLFSDIFKRSMGNLGTCPSPVSRSYGSEGPLRPV